MLRPRQSKFEDRKHVDTGDVARPYARSDRPLQPGALAQRPRWGLHGNLRYSRLPHGVVNRINDGHMLGEAEEATKVRIQELPKAMGSAAAARGQRITRSGMWPSTS